jgi:hypothetical protein
MSKSATRLPIRAPQARNECASPPAAVRVPQDEFSWPRRLSGDDAGRSRFRRTPPLALFAARAVVAGIVLGWLAFSAVATVDVELIARMIELAARRMDVLIRFLPFGG